MSFLYPRTVTVRRPNPQTGTGAIGYGGETAANETALLFGQAFPASIQHRSGKGKQGGSLPADAPSRADWYIFIRAPNNGDITENDIIVDDLGKRYQVIAAYWNSLGYRVSAELLQM